MKLAFKVAALLLGLFLTWQLAVAIHRRLPMQYPDARIPVSGPEQHVVVTEEWAPAGLQKVRPLATYKIQAVVLSTSPYRKSYDNAAVASQWDVAVAWGPVADPRVLRAVKPRQFGRYVFWSGLTPQTAPVVVPLLVGEQPESLAPSVVLERHIANIHVICDEGVNSQIGELRPGQIITLRGDLVEVEFPGGGKWRSSLTREDTGNGACEIMHVRSLTSP